MPTLVERVSRGERDAAGEAEAYLRESEDLNLRKALVQHYTRQQGRRKDAGASHLERDFAAALRHMRPLFEADPDHPGSGVRFATLLIENGRFSEASAVLEKLREAARGGPFGPEANILGALARMFYMRGDLTQAGELLDHIIARALESFGGEMNDERARFLGSLLARRARIFVNSGDPAGALKLIGDCPHAIEHEFLGRTKRRAELLLQEPLPSARPDAYPVDLDRLTVACVKHGPKYGPDYVNRLYSMVRRHLPGNWRFVCLTDDPAGLREEVGVIDISKIKIQGWWTKLALFDPRMPIADPTVFYLDLDTVVVGDLGFIEGLKVGFHIFEHMDSPCFNSSIMLFDRAFAAPVSQKIRREDIARLDGDQDWIEVCLPGLDTFAPGLIRLYKSLEPDLDPAELTGSGARIVTFPTAPKPHQVEGGWVAEHWR